MNGAMSRRGGKSHRSFTFSTWEREREKREYGREREKWCCGVVVLRDYLLVLIGCLYVLISLLICLTRLFIDVDRILIAFDRFVYVPRTSRSSF